LTDSEEFRQQLDSLQADRSELQAKLTVAEKRLVEVAEMESASRDRLSEISRITGQLEAREREIQRFPLYNGTINNNKISFCIHN
jgi:chromosome segregation ATPase